MAETVYRITTFFNRKPGITEEQFNHRKPPPSPKLQNAESTNP
jgi:hypothetical protein